MTTLVKQDQLHSEYWRADRGYTAQPTIASHEVSMNLGTLDSFVRILGATPATRNHWLVDLWGGTSIHSNSRDFLQVFLGSSNEPQG